MPDRTITVAGQLVALRTITSAALAIIPATCRCTTALRELLAAAARSGVTVYLIVSPGRRAAIARLTAPSRSPSVRLATDTDHVLAAANPHAVGLTLLLVDYRGKITIAPGPLTPLQLARRLAHLSPSPSPGQSTGQQAPVIPGGASPQG